MPDSEVGVAGIRFGLTAKRPGMVAGGIGAALTGAIAIVGGVYYSFVAAAPGAKIPGLTAAIPWVCLALVVAGVVVAVVVRARRPAVWSDMGLLFQDV